MVTDHVCGMKIDPQTAGARSVSGDTTYYFCSEGCKQQFERAPAHYAEHPGLPQDQQVTLHGSAVIARDEDIQTQGVDVVTAHPHAMTSGADMIAMPGEQTTRRGVDVVEPVKPVDSSEASPSGDVRLTTNLAAETPTG